ncbi:MAG: dihydrodipicolinate synthase family protein [Bacteroidaceae bacterium]|nr:dihydrodipicolinate synthase family protein [Bacteroidaceae bacterium]
MKLKKQFGGVVVPLVSPMTADGKADVESVERLVNNLAKYGVAPLLLGTTGEGNSVPVEEGAKMITAAKKAAAGRVTVYVGLGGCCVSDSHAAAKKFIAAGADVIAATLPNYYALTPEQMYIYYKELADVLTVPLMLYNITITTHMSIPLDIVERLSHHPNIVGMKDSENNIPRIEECLKMFKDREDFCYFCGCAANSAVALKNGADGIVPSVGNFIPKAYQDLFEAGINGDEEKAERLQQWTIEIGKINTEGLTLGESLAGLKVICKMKGLCDTYMWPPLTELAPEIVDRIQKQVLNAKI